MDFVSKSVSDDETRLVLYYIQYKDCLFTSSDGYRLHQFYIDIDLVEGLYTLIKTKDSYILDECKYKDLKFPNIDSIIPKEYIDKPTVDLKSSKYIEVSISECLFRLSKNNICVNYTYITDLLKTKEDYKIYCIANNKPIVAQNSCFINNSNVEFDYRAVLMPILLKDFDTQE